MPNPLSPMTMYPDLSRPLSKRQREVLYEVDRATRAIGGLTAKEVHLNLEITSVSSTWVTLNKLVEVGLLRKTDTSVHGVLYSACS